MNGLPIVKIGGSAHTPVVEVNGQEATDGLRALAVTMQAGELPRVMMEYYAVPSFEGIAQCTVNVQNPLREVLGRIDVMKLREAVNLAGMGEHPADVVLEELIRLVDDLEPEHAGSGTSRS